jgi:hypothetical protein
LSSAAAIVRSALSCVLGGMPSWSSLLRDHFSIGGSNSGSIQPASSVAMMWIVFRISQVRNNDRSPVLARSTSAAVRRRVRERKDSRAAGGSCAWMPAVSRATSAGSRTASGLCRS